MLRECQIQFDNKVNYAEVQFFFLDDSEGTDKFTAHALVSVYGTPDPDLLDLSFRTLWACPYQGSDNLHIIPVTDITSVVSMQPFPVKEEEQDNNLWFVVEKSGLDDTEISGYVDPIIEDNNSN